MNRDLSTNNRTRLIVSLVSYVLIINLVLNVGSCIQFYSSGIRIAF